MPICGRRLDIHFEYVNPLNRGLHWFQLYIYIYIFENYLNINNDYGFLYQEMKAISFILRVLSFVVYSNIE